VSATSIGIDFGTSNSAVAALSSDGTVRLAQFTHAITKKQTDTAPTVLFFPSYEKDTHFGHDAVARYLFTGLEGRFLQSMKTFLPSKTFTQTMIRGRQFTIEDLVAVFLRHFLERAEAALGVKITGEIVVGRPAIFSKDPDADRLAEERLKRAAEAAGLTGFRFLLEPIAAALAYEASLDRDETVLVADLGGGTSDFTLMRVGPSHRGKADRRSSLLATRGVPIAGDKIDGEIVRTALLEKLGAGSGYRPFTGHAPIPHWIFQRLLQWNHVSLLKSRETLEFLRRVHQTSDRPEAIATLLRLVDEDQGYLLFRAVERAKRELATSETARIADEEHELAVEATITRAELESAAKPLIDEIAKTAESTLEAAAIEPRRVDAVFMTGGTSLVPAVRARFEAMFGVDRLRAGETFTSVAVGLARSGQTDLGSVAGQTPLGSRAD
jgi:hypothetical chaperone protein